MERKPRGYWDLEKLKEVAKPYSSRSEFKRENLAAYSATVRLGLLKEVCKEMPLLHKSKGYWTLSRLQEAANLYTSRKEFERKNIAAYSASVRLGVLDIVCKKMPRLGSLTKRLIYAFEFSGSNCVYVGLTYNVNKRFREHTAENGCGTVNDYIKKNSEVRFEFKILSKFVDQELSIKLESQIIEKYKIDGWILLNKAKAGGLGGRAKKWTKGKCTAEALLYTSRSEFQQSSGSAYQAAIKNKWLPEVCQHMKSLSKKPRGFWTKESCLKVALLCKSKSEFNRKARGGYRSAVKNKFLSEICTHMKLPKQT